MENISFQEIAELQRQLSASLPSFSSVLSVNVQQLICYIKENRSGFRNASNINLLLPLLHYAIRNPSNIAQPFDVAAELQRLLKIYADEPHGLQIAVQLIFQFVNSIEPNDNTYGVDNESICNELVDILWQNLSTDNLKEIDANNILVCLQRHAKVFRCFGCISMLWSRVEAITNIGVRQLRRIGQILVHLYDELSKCVERLHTNSKLIQIIHQLLLSQERDNRKYAYFLLKKMLADRLELRNEDVTSVRHRWTVYITILENLEENQSHLILPSLECLSSIELATTSDQNENDWPKWLQLLHRQILDHKNILVVRWSLAYFMTSNSCGQLELSVLMQLLEAANNNALYNLEAQCMPDAHIYSYLKNSNRAELFQCMANINWKAVPLHFWLNALANTAAPVAEQISTDIILPLSSRIRALPNVAIRRSCIELMYKIFNVEISEMTLGKFIAFLESLHNTQDYLKKAQKHCVNKLKVWKTACYKEAINFTEFIYAFFENFDEWQLFADIPIEKHGYFRFLFIRSWLRNQFSADLTEFIKTAYGIDYSTAQNLSLPELTQLLYKQLAWNETRAENTLARTLAISLYACTRKDLINLDITLDELFTLGTEEVIEPLIQLAAKYEKTIDEATLLHLIQCIGNRKIAVSNSLCNLLKYCKSLHTAQNYSNTLELVLNCFLGRQDVEIVASMICKENAFNEDTYFKYLTTGYDGTGDARIEYSYSVLRCDNKSHNLLRHVFMKNISEVSFNNINEKAKLLHDSTRYYENSQIHRLKMRIACALIALFKSHNLLFENVSSFDYNNIWHAVLNQNNQLNISYMLELLTALCTTDFGIIYQKLQELSGFSTTQQMSIISVAYTWINLNWDTNKVSKDSNFISDIVNKLLPLTMGATFQTRLFAQLVIYCLLQRYEQKTLSQVQLCDTIKIVIGEHLDELLADVRLKLAFIYQFARGCNSAGDIILCITNAPFDEYYLSEELPHEILKCKQLYLKRINTKGKLVAQVNNDTNNSSSIGNAAISSIVQRKMNPDKDILPQHSLVTYPRDKESQIYVVASLIDKLPNLGGIARSCEVLGIKNLVISSKRHTEQTDFKSLSMTAEKSLNIIEVTAKALDSFLIDKHSQGYSIVGAEQTANSQDFTNFIFPKKCVLLLGHEKEGIPSNLLGFLDYAVEIPQFGNVRSLNVHVTGALFMWEYCKQHIVKNK